MNWHPILPDYGFKLKYTMTVVNNHKYQFNLIQSHSQQNLPFYFSLILVLLFHLSLAFEL